MPSPTQISDARKLVEEVAGVIEQPITIVMGRHDVLTQEERALDEKIQEFREEAGSRIAAIQEDLERNIAPLLVRRDSLDSDRVMLNQLLEAIKPSQEKLQRAAKLIAPANPPVKASGNGRPVTPARPVLGNGN